MGEKLALWLADVVGQGLFPGFLPGLFVTGLWVCFQQAAVQLLHQGAGFPLAQPHSDRLVQACNKDVGLTFGLT